jgi:hypothetical protein
MKLHTRIDNAEINEYNQKHRQEVVKLVNKSNKLIKNINNSYKLDFCNEKL